MIIISNKNMFSFFPLDFEFSEGDSTSASGNSFPMRITYTAGGKINAP